MDVVIREDLGRVARLCMNRVKRRNALSSDLIESLLEHLRATREDETIGAVILTGAGKAFVLAAISREAWGPTVAFWIPTTTVLLLGNS